MDEGHGGPSSPKAAQGNWQEVVVERTQTISLDGSKTTWIKEMQRKMQDAEPFWKTEPTKKSACIFRVPVTLRGQSPESYQPKVVAIGPYHRHNAELLIKDRDKWGCVNYFVSTRSLDLEKWHLIMMSKEQEARMSYSDGTPMDSGSFLEMLLLDGCFILHAIENFDSMKDYMGCPSEQIMLDLLLLENQIPFFALVQLYGCVSHPGDIIFYTICSFWHTLPMWWYIENVSRKPNEVLHLLHLYRLSLVPTEDKSTDVDGAPRSILKNFPSATELQDQSGVKFKKIPGREMLGISFRKGVMKIPVLQIHDAVNILLGNVIAFEQCYPSIKPCLTTYAAFMDCLINNESDVKLLERSGILSNMLPSRRDATFFFSKLRPRSQFSRDVDDVFAEVNKYHDNKWNRWCAILKHNYFANPWVTLSVGSAVILLTLSMVQTWYSVMSYYHG